MRKQFCGDVTVSGLWTSSDLLLARWANWFHPGSTKHHLVRCQGGGQGVGQGVGQGGGQGGGQGSAAGMESCSLMDIK